jgi:predicted MFS family arabinose efflux permease
LSSLVVDRAGAARGAALGMTQSAGALGRIIGPVAGGLLFEHVGIGWPYVVAAVLLLLAAGLVTRV